MVDSKNINLLITFILYLVLAPDVLRGKEGSPQILEDQTKPRYFHPSRRHSKSQYTLFFYKQPVYKQPSLEWQIAKQLSGLTLLSLSNNKNYRLKKSGVFLCDNRKKAVKLLKCTKIQLSQKHYWENFKITDHKYQFWILKIFLFLADIIYLVKPLSNH